MDLEFIIKGSMIILFLTFIVIFLITFIKHCIVRGRSDALTIVEGKVGGNKAAKIVHGGLTFCIPIIQHWFYLPLTPRILNINLQNALSKENIRIYIPCTVSVAVESENEDVMQTAAIRLPELMKDDHAFNNFVADIIFGNLRSVCADMSIEEINGNRQLFLEKVTNVIKTEIAKIGLRLINVNINDIKDAAGIIENLGKKAESTTRANAEIEIADAQRKGESEVSRLDMEKRKQLAMNEQAAVEQENIAKAAIALSEEEKNRKIAEAKSNNDAIAQKVMLQNDAEVKKAKAETEAQAEIAASTAQKNADVARANNEKEAFEAQKLAAEARELLNVAEMKANISAENEKKILEAKAQGEAEGNRLLKEAENKAQAIKKIAEAEAEGIKKLVAAAGSPEAVVFLRMQEQLPNIINTFAKSISDRKIDNLTVIDSGNGEGLKGLTGQLLNSVPQIMACLDALGIDTSKLKKSLPVKDEQIIVQNNVDEEYQKTLEKGVKKMSRS